MSILPNTPTSADVLARLKADQAEITVLAEVVRGPFTATIKRHDAKDGDEAYSDAPQIEIDCSDQDGGECFCDLTVLPRHVGDYLAVSTEISADFLALTNGIEIESQDGAFEGEWHRSVGTVGTPSLRVGHLKSEVYASTTWQENSAGDRTEVMVLANVNNCQDFTPQQAMEFALHLAQEASRAMSIEKAGGAA